MASGLMKRLHEVLLTPEQRAHLDKLRVNDGGHGYDAFGAHKDWLTLAMGIARPVYEKYFRVVSHGGHHIPTSGPAIVACNHSGTVPLDAMMVAVDIVRQTDPPRTVRSVMDHFVGLMPFISTVFTRAGGVGGSRGNFRTLLDNGELILVFPEGVGGIGKSFFHRYQLQKWNVGHAELAIRHGAPVVPSAVIGAEEQMPQIGRINMKLFGAPYLPLVASPVPLPVRYHIHYGPPVRLNEMYEPAAADDPAVVTEAAGKVKRAVAELIEAGLEARDGVFA